MAVELTSPVLGQNPGYTYTGTLEDWLLAEGYAKRVGYTGPGVANSGAASVTDLGNDPRLPANRGDKAQFPAEDVTGVTIANDGTNLTKERFPNTAFDFDKGGVDEDPTTPAADGDANADGVADPAP